MASCMRELQKTLRDKARPQLTSHFFVLTLPPEGSSRFESSASASLTTLHLTIALRVVQEDSSVSPEVNYTENESIIVRGGPR